MCVLVHL